MSCISAPLSQAVGDTRSMWVGSQRALIGCFPSVSNDFVAAAMFSINVLLISALTLCAWFRHRVLLGSQIVDAIFALNFK